MPHLLCLFPSWKFPGGGHALQSQCHKHAMPLSLHTLSHAIFPFSLPACPLLPLPCLTSLFRHYNFDDIDVWRFGTPTTPPDDSGVCYALSALPALPAYLPLPPASCLPLLPVSVARRRWRKDLEDLDILGDRAGLGDRWERFKEKREKLTALQPGGREKLTQEAPSLPPTLPAALLHQA